MPSNYKYNIENVESIKAFFEKMKLRNNKVVIEFRDRSWWKEIDQIENIGIVFCSVDAPNLPNNIVTTNNTIYTLDFMALRNGIIMFTPRGS